MAREETNEYPIDFVITWVDSADPEWQESYAKYRGGSGDQRENRFRDMGTLRYLFRGIEKFTPWVNRVYFVTCGQRPEWLNTAHPKLRCVDHREFIPAEYLPTFSSNTIEVMLHRIPELSEHFVSFNDDMFLVAPASREVFFRDGLPCDAAVMSYNPILERPMFLIPIANAAVLNEHFDKRQAVRGQLRNFYNVKYGKYLLRNIQFAFERQFPGFRSFHLPVSLLKSVYEEVWEAEETLLHDTCSSKFRVLTDVNEWLMEGWQICSGRFVPRSVKIGHYADMTDRKSIEEAADALASGRYTLFCANDDGVEDYDFLAQRLGAAFETILPEKSGFEL